MCAGRRRRSAAWGAPTLFGMDLRLIGKRAKRADSPERLTGQVRFTGDLVLPNLLYARLVRSPHASARIGSIDTAAALAAPGVARVLTAEDLPVTNIREA